jgi:hypothetical protein
MQNAILISGIARPRGPHYRRHPQQPVANPARMVSLNTAATLMGLAKNTAEKRLAALGITFHVDEFGKRLPRCISAADLARHGIPASEAVLDFAEAAATAKVDAANEKRRQKQLNAKRTLQP